MINKDKSKKINKRRTNREIKESLLRIQKGYNTYLQASPFPYNPSAKNSAKRNTLLATPDLKRESFSKSSADECDLLSLLSGDNGQNQGNDRFEHSWRKRKMMKSVIPKKLLLEAAHNKDELKYNELIDNAAKIKKSLIKEKDFIKGLSAMNSKFLKSSAPDRNRRNLDVKPSYPAKNNSFNQSLQVSVLNNKIIQKHSEFRG
eukprot:CAMPEP_0168351714 /NCGR_PEP_ID=MMETSP0213-20121227/22066_1 /TAXON_ID=151035 /ORGANISM="Euplotes harpa, Strain FSP1.4" /LENGTH=202 /DNA_ID=CAMNT_0008362679 /DNA_START=221 /DNA_END=829 /DNA_ORIENTATION=+